MYEIPKREVVAASLVTLDELSTWLIGCAIHRRQTLADAFRDCYEGNPDDLEMEWLCSISSFCNRDDIDAGNQEPQHG